MTVDGGASDGDAIGDDVDLRVILKTLIVGDDDGDGDDDDGDSDDDGDDDDDDDDDDLTPVVQ